MTITASVNTVGVVRATEIFQSARADAALDHRRETHTVSIEIAHVNEGEAQERESGRSLASSQKRVIDIRV